nr:reverse transcriptase domain-containing protein [Tanacetum cinerariifolium]
MTDNRTMAEMLRAPTEGCAEAIVVPSILAEQFELKHSLINMITSKQFFRLEKDNSHDHVRWFNKITSTIKYKDVPNSVIKLILFPFSLAGAARRWLEKEPLRSITTWDDLVSKFINEFFPPSRTTNLRNEILNFQQKFDESFHEAWESKDISNEVKESPDTPLVKELVSDGKLEKKTIFSSVAKREFVRPKQHEILVRKPSKYTEMYRLTAITMKGKGGVIDSGCSRHMPGNMSYLSKYEEIDGGYVAFRGDPKGGKSTGKDTKCVILSPDFKLLDESQVLLRVPRKNNMYSVDLNNVALSRGLTCLFTKATLD